MAEKKLCRTCKYYKRTGGATITKRNIIFLARCTKKYISISSISECCEDYVNALKDFMESI